MQVLDSQVVIVSGSRYEVQMCKDAKGEYRMRVFAANNECIFPPEGYQNKADCISNINLLADIFGQVDI
jgi:uncharacterized protein YegP (UPF0339 family)